MHNQRKNKKFPEKEVKKMKKLAVFLLGFFLVIGLALPVSTLAYGLMPATGDSSEPALASGHPGTDSALYSSWSWLSGWGRSLKRMPGFYRELRDLRDEYRDAKQALLDEKEEVLAAIEEEYAEQIEALEDQLDELKDGMQDAIDAVEAEYAEEIEALEGQIDDLKEAKKEALTELRQQFLADLKDAIADVDVGDIISVVKNYIADKKEIKQAFEEEIQELKEQLADLEDEKEDAIQEVEDAFEEEIQDIEDQIADLEDEMEDAIADIEEDYEGQLADLDDEYRDQVTDLYHEYFGENRDPPQWVFNYFFAEPKGNASDMGLKEYSSPIATSLDNWIKGAPGGAVFDLNGDGVFDEEDQAIFTEQGKEYKESILPSDLLGDLKDKFDLSKIKERAAGPFDQNGDGVFDEADAALIGEQAKANAMAKLDKNGDGTFDAADITIIKEEAKERLKQYKQGLIDMPKLLPHMGGMNDRSSLLVK